MRPVVFGEVVIDDDDELVVGVVGLGEVAAANQRDAHGLEVVADDLRGRSGGLVGAARIDISVGNERLDAVAGGGKGGGEAGGFDAGQLAQLLKQPVVEGIDLGLCGVLLLRQRVGGGGDVVGAKAEIGLAHIAEAAQQQAGSGEQDERDGDLRDHQRGAQARVAAAGRAAASAFFQRGVDVGAEGGESRALIRRRSR